MAKLKYYISKHKLTFGGILLGAIGGYLYYYFVGCKSGTCLITSQPANSTLYGATRGGLIGSLFKKPKTKTTGADPVNTEKQK